MQNHVSGLILVPNGKDLGKMMGDKYYDRDLQPPVGRLTLDETEDNWGYEYEIEFERNGVTEIMDNTTNHSTLPYPTPPPDLHTYHPWGIFFTIIGTVLLDFDADACQSPSRAYLLDVTLPGRRIRENQ